MSEGTIGKYRLIAELGQGGMADVFLAVATGPAGLGFSKLVVIKRLREHLANDPDFVAMLVDEARIAARLNHPNVVQTIEIGEADGQYFLAMEYLDGQAFRTILRRASASGSNLPQPLHYGVLVRVLTGLHHAHELADYDRSPLHIVHRDVTPHNVFVTYDGQVKVVDFGIAKAVGRVSETRHGVIKGKAAYMAPEQARGQPVDRRADIFSVGVMLWEAAVGARMWAGLKDDTDIIRRLNSGRIPTSPRAVGANVPEAIDAICQRALAYDREERFATAAEFEAALSAHVDASRQASDRELGAYVSKLFVDAREKAQGIIETQLSKLGSTSSASFQLVPLPSDSAALSGSAPAVSISHLQPLPPSKEATASTLVDSALKRTMPSAERRKPRAGRVVALGLTGLLALGVAGWAARTRILRARLAVRTPPVATAPAVSVAPATSETPLPQEVTVTLRASPAEAQFSIDDGPYLPNPYVGRRAKDGATHRVTVAAAGYSTLNQDITFEEDVALQLSLARDVSTDAGGRGPVRRWGPRRR
jgi:serine/threonine protein kinase